MFGVRKCFQNILKTSETSSSSNFGFRYDVWMIQDLPTFQNRDIIEIVKIGTTFAWFHAV